MAAPKFVESDVYDVTYILADHGWKSIRADFNLEQASRMVVQLYSGNWGDVIEVKIVKDRRLVDVRTTAEVEEEVIS